MFSKKIILNDKGVTLIEAIITAGIIGASAFVFMNVSSNYKESSITIGRDHQTSEIVSETIDQIFSQAKTYQVNYNASSSKIMNLPYGWDEKGNFGKRSECNDCKGSYGVQLRPVPKHPGLIYVDVELEHPKWGKNNKSYTRVISL